MTAVVADLPAEQAVLGALLVYGEPSHVRTLVKRGLKPEHFYWSKHGDIFAAAISLAERNAFLDPVTLTAELEQHGKRMTAHDIDMLAAFDGRPGNLGEYAKLVRHLAILRGQRTLALRLVDAIDRRHDDAVEPLVEHLSRSLPAQDPEIAKRTTSLKVVSPDGEVIRESTEERDCPGCLALKDQLKGAEKEIRRLRRDVANLTRDREAEAQKEALWLVGQQLFDLWRQKTKRSARCTFTLDRYEAILPFLRRKNYGPEMCERAIAGVGYDAIVSRKARLNGTYQRYDAWEWIFKTADRFEEYANRAPLDWKPTLGSLGTDELARRRAQREAS